VHLLNGLYDAHFDRAPVLAITGLPYHDLTDTFTQQDVDHVRLFSDVAAHTTRIMSAAHVENAVSLACRMALSHRGVAHVAIPTDVQEEKLEAAGSSPRTVPHHVSFARASSVCLPRSTKIDRAAEGDGGLSMLLGELATVVRYRLPIRIVVVKNDSLAQIKWEQMLFLGNPEYECDLQSIDFVGVAEAMGLRGWRISTADECGPVLDQALAHDGPVLVEALIDPNEPLLPPKRMEKYARLWRSAGRGHAGGERDPQGAFARAGAHDAQALRIRAGCIPAHAGAMGRAGERRARGFSAASGALWNRGCGWLARAGAIGRAGERRRVQEGPSAAYSGALRKSPRTAISAVPASPLRRATCARPKNSCRGARRFTRGRRRPRRPPRDPLARTSAR